MHPFTFCTCFFLLKVTKELTSSAPCAAKFRCEKRKKYKVARYDRNYLLKQTVFRPFILNCMTSCWSQHTSDIDFFVCATSPS